MPAQSKNQPQLQNATSAAPSGQQLPAITSQTPPRPEPEKELFSWKAPSRAFVRKGREFWVKVFVIASIFGFILYIAEGVMPVVLLISLIFLFYILTTVEPEIVVYKITNKGIRIAEKLNEWDSFTRFWFTKRGKSSLLVLEALSITGRLELIIDEKDKEKLKEVLTQYIPEEEAIPTNIDKASEWLSKKFS